MKGSKANATSLLSVLAMNQHDLTVSVVSLPVHSVTSQTDGDAVVSKVLQSMPEAGQCSSCRAKASWADSGAGGDRSSV